MRGVGMGFYGVPPGVRGDGPGYAGGFVGPGLFNFGGTGFGPYGFGYDIGPTDRNLFGGSNYGRGSGLGYEFPARGGWYSIPAPTPAPAPFPTGRTYEPGDGYRYPLYYDPVGRTYIYYPVSR